MLRRRRPTTSQSTHSTSGHAGSGKLWGDIKDRGNARTIPVVRVVSPGCQAAANPTGSRFLGGSGMSRTNSISGGALGRRATSVATLVAALLGPSCMPAGLAQQSRPLPAAAARSAIVDPAVMPAGGCQGCGASGCRACRGRHGGHHTGCRDGKCHAHCPVRPQEFGFYGTRWRRWPDNGVMPVAHDRAVTPVTPPKSQVPRSEEESRRGADEPAAPEPGTAGESATGSATDLPQPRPDQPRGDEEPTGPLKPPADAQPRLLPQSLRQGDTLDAGQVRRMTRDRAASTIAWGAARTPGPGADAGDAVAPEPDGRVTVVAAAESDDEADEAAVGPARRRFVARRLPGTEPPAAAPRQDDVP